MSKDSGPAYRAGPLVLAVGPLGIFVGLSGSPPSSSDHARALPAEKRAFEQLGVEPIGLGAPVGSRGLNAAMSTAPPPRINPLSSRGSKGGKRWLSSLRLLKIRAFWLSIIRRYPGSAAAPVTPGTPWWSIARKAVGRRPSRKPNPAGQEGSSVKGLDSCPTTETVGGRYAVGFFLRLPARRCSVLPHTKANSCRRIVNAPLMVQSASHLSSSGCTRPKGATSRGSAGLASVLQCR